MVCIYLNWNSSALAPINKVHQFLATFFFQNFVVPRVLFLSTQFLPGSGRVDTAVWMHHLDANKTAREEARRQLHKNVASYTEQVLAATPHKTPTIRPPASHHENYPS